MSKNVILCRIANIGFTILSFGLAWFGVGRTTRGYDQSLILFPVIFLTFSLGFLVLVGLSVALFHRDRLRSPSLSRFTLRTLSDPFQVMFQTMLFTCSGIAGILLHFWRINKVDLWGLGFLTSTALGCGVGWYLARRLTRSTLNRSEPGSGVYS
jgi:uncharacterized membrane protein